MTTLYSFAPIVDSRARVLILGSMPGQASLSANQYYAHPQNAFWRIMGEFLGFNSAVVSYVEKTNALKKAHIALWDVLQSCKRKGSLDSSIEPQSQTVNDFRVFFNTYPQICAVFFNGTKAEACFKRYVLQNNIPDTIPLIRLPSTSPAHATVSFAHKRDKWHQMLAEKLSISQRSSDKLSV